MNLPSTISNRILREFAAPNETHAVRVQMLKTCGPSTYRFRGIKRQYLFERDGVTGMHVLDVPASLWMQHIPAGAYKPNLSIAHDIQGRPMLLAPLMTLWVPWKGAVPVEGAADASTEVPFDFEPMRTLFVKLGAPSILFEALETLQHEGPAVFKDIVDSLPDGVIVGSPEAAAMLAGEPPAKPAPPLSATETPAAKRMREKRARDKAKKQLQSA